MNPNDLTSLEEALGYRFQRAGLLRLALSHSSYARESQPAGSAEPAADNEQLEFLGDSVLSFVISAELVRRFPHFREGALSKLRAHLVSEKHLSEIARRFGIGVYLQLGRGEGVAARVSEKVNDTYLKAQGVLKGVESYSETTVLFLRAIDTESLSIGRLLSSSERGASAISGPRSDSPHRTHQSGPKHAG